jgi:hypothetical protein
MMGGLRGVVLLGTSVTRGSSFGDVVRLSVGEVAVLSLDVKILLLP